MMLPSRERIFADLNQLVSFNSVHGEETTRADYEACATWVKMAFEQVSAPLGGQVDMLEGIDSSYTILATIPRVGAAAGRKRVLLYAHFDVVPVGPLEEWETSPFELHERDGRWWARGAADCKGHVAAHLEALRLLAGVPTRPDITVVIEGSEENGGRGLSHLVETRPELFESDTIFIVDTGNPEPGTPSLVTMLRGSAQVLVTVTTLEQPVHSGKFGGAAPDAVAALMRTLDSLRDEDGHCTIDGLDCTGVWNGEEYPEEKFRHDAGLLEGTEVPTGDIADFVWARPAVTVTGFTSTPVAEAINAVPASAQARVNLRVPPRQHDDNGRQVSTARAAQMLTQHLRAHTPWGAHIDTEILSVNRSFAADEHGPAMTLLRECLSEAFGHPTHSLGTGGSIPLAVQLQEAFPDAEIALFGAADLSAAIHSPQESVSPDELAKIIHTQVLFLSRY